MNNLKITELKFTPVKPDKGLIGFVTIILNDCLFLSGIAIFKLLNADGYRILYPAKKTAHMEYKYYHPLNKETSKFFETAILTVVEEEIKNILDLKE